MRRTATGFLLALVGALALAELNAYGSKAAVTPLFPSAGQQVAASEITFRWRVPADEWMWSWGAICLVSRPGVTFEDCERIQRGNGVVFYHGGMDSTSQSSYLLSHLTAGRYWWMVRSSVRECDEPDPLACVRETGRIPFTVAPMLRLYGVSFTRFQYNPELLSLRPSWDSTLNGVRMQARAFSGGRQIWSDTDSESARAGPQLWFRFPRWMKEGTRVTIKVWLSAGKRKTPVRSYVRRAPFR